MIGLGKSVMVPVFCHLKVHTVNISYSVVMIVEVVIIKNYRKLLIK